jgi:hypothetical protein
MTPRDQTFFWQSSPLILTFSSNIQCVCGVYLCISFCYGFPLKRMGANNRFREWSGGVIKNPAVSLTHWHRGTRSHSLIETMESFPKMAKSDPAVTFSLWDLIPRYHRHRGIWSYDVIDTAGIRTFQTSISIFSANTKQYAMIQGPSGIVLWKKPKDENLLSESL